MSWKACAIVRLRAHHLLCILTFAGEGYSPAFVANMAGIVARIGAGEPIEVVVGPDDICAPLAGSGDAHCHAPAELERDSEALRAFPGRRPLVLDRTGIAALRAQFAAGTIRGACASCSWFARCTEIAAAGYVGASL
jgi:hypothetical protein